MAGRSSTPRWTEPQKAILRLLAAGKRLRFEGTVFLVAGTAGDELDQPAFAMKSVLRLARMGALRLVQVDEPKYPQLYAVARRGNVPTQAAITGKDAASGAHLDLEEAA